MGKRGAGIPWDQPGATPLEDILDAIDAFNDRRFDPPGLPQEFIAHWARCHEQGLDYLSTLQAWEGPAVLAEAVTQTLRGYSPQAVLHDELVAWDVMDVDTGGQWLEFMTEPFERI